MGGLSCEQAAALNENRGVCALRPCAMLRTPVWPLMPASRATAHSSLSLRRYFGSTAAAEAKLPFPAGFEAVGVVSAAADDVRTLAEGQPCATMDYGGFAEWAVVAAKHVFPLPEATPEMVRSHLRSCQKLQEAACCVSSAVPPLRVSPAACLATSPLERCLLSPIPGRCAAGGPDDLGPDGQHRTGAGRAGERRVVGWLVGQGLAGLHRASRMPARLPAAAGLRHYSTRLRLMPPLLPLSTLPGSARARPCW